MLTHKAAKQKEIPCDRWSAGVHCRFGDECRYAHDKNTDMATCAVWRQTVDGIFSKIKEKHKIKKPEKVGPKYCHRGPKCPYAHRPNGSTNVKQKRQRAARAEQRARRNATGDAGNAGNADEPDGSAAWGAADVVVTGSTCVTGPKAPDASPLSAVARKFPPKLLLKLCHAVGRQPGGMTAAQLIKAVPQLDAHLRTLIKTVPHLAAHLGRSRTSPNRGIVSVIVAVVKLLPAFRVVTKTGGTLVFLESTAPSVNDPSAADDTVNCGGAKKLGATIQQMGWTAAAESGKIAKNPFAYMQRAVHAKAGLELGEIASDTGQVIDNAAVEPGEVTPDDLVRMQCRQQCLSFPFLTYASPSLAFFKGGSYNTFIIKKNFRKYRVGYKKTIFLSFWKGP